MVVGGFAVEISIFFLFAVSAYLAYKIKKLDFLIYATIFAFIFENIGVYFSGNISGYVYSGDFLVYLFGVPLFVILAWGILLLGAHLVSLRLHMSKISRVFFVAFFVTLVDFVIEGVSVNLGYWFWLGAGAGGGIFSSIVPSNFVGWLGVSFGFILCYEYFDRKWLSMFVGYFALLFLATIFELMNWVFGFSGGERYISLGVILFGFIGFWIYFYHKNRILKRNKKDFRVNFRYAKYIVFMRFIFYSFAIFYFFQNGYYLDLSYLGIVFFVVFLEAYFFLRFDGFVKKQV
ncbi:MAG: carotenoid biosynthesis protein [Nanoarchaeota archaeon]|nr:carotenoid biosynthesis protein [Nanoarchaeota archaeon]